MWLLSTVQYSIRAQLSATWLLGKYFTILINFWKAYFLSNIVCPICVFVRVYYCSLLLCVLYSIELFSSLRNADISVIYFTDNMSMLFR